ncbi:MAG: CRISPR-associated CARF protein Csa3 [Candidatus Micrarchaeia archaeon]
MGETTLIATFYSFEPFVAAAHAYSPSRIHLIIAKDSKKDIEKHLAKVHELYGKVAEIREVEVDAADIFAVAKKTVELLEKSNRSIVNVSGGWKLMAQGVLYGCYARPELVEKIVCNELPDINRLVELPKLSFGLSQAKKELLEEIEKRNGKPIAEIAEKLGKTPGMLYQHLKELKEAGYVDEKFGITLAGKIAVL